MTKVTRAAANQFPFQNRIDRRSVSSALFALSSYSHSALRYSYSYSIKPSAVLSVRWISRVCIDTQSRAPSNLEETVLVLQTLLVVALCNVQWNRLRGPEPLITRIAQGTIERFRNAKR